MIIKKLFFFYMKKAAELGYINALLKYGLMLEKRIGTEKNVTEAV